MIERIVLIQTTGDQERVSEALDLIMQLNGNVPGLIEARTGTDESTRTRGYNKAFVLRFSDADAVSAWSYNSLHEPIRSVLSAETNQIVFDLHV